MMRVICDACGYNSGFYNDTQALADKVYEDGGLMDMLADDQGRMDGWSISCPNFCDPQYTILE